MKNNMNEKVIKILDDIVGKENYLLKENKLFLKKVTGDIVISLGKVCKVENILFLFQTSPQRNKGFEFLIYLK